MTFLFLIMTVMGVGSAWADKWDGTVATSIATGSGTQASPYIINSAAELAYFGSQMNGKTWYVQLGVDIDLNSREWTYGKNSASNFKGHFDGNGKTISNLSIVPTSAKNNGFFSSLQGTAASRAEVKNLIIDGVTISQTGDLANTTTTGALAGNVTQYTDITNVTVKNVAITFANLTNANYVGGFVGRVEKNNSTITDCFVENPSIEVTGNISDGASFIGGAIGQVAGSNNLITTINGLTVTSPSVTINNVAIKDCYIGAVFGRINTYSDIKNMTVSHPVLAYDYKGNPNVALNIGSFAGGIVGNASLETTITDITINDKAQITIGTTANIAATNISNVKAGLVGQLSTYVSIEKWTVKGSEILVNGNLLTTASYLGGLAGYITTGCKIKGECSVENPKIEIKGNVGVASYMGGAIGDFIGGAGNISTINGLTVENSSVTVNKNSIANSNVGGVFGRIGNYSIVNGVTAKSPSVTYNNDGNPNFALNIGSFAGYIVGSAQQETVVTGTKVEGTAQVTIDDDANKATNIITNIKAGLIGQVSTNVRLDDWTIENTSVKANGNLGATSGTAASYIGGFAGYMVSAASSPLNISGIKINGNSNVDISGNIAIDNCYLGGFAGYIYDGDAVNAPVNIDQASIEGTSTVHVGGAAQKATYMGGFAGYIYGKTKAGSTLTINKVALNKSDVSIDGETSTASYYGGMAGRVNTACNLNDWEVTTESKVSIKKVSKASYIGGAIGSVDGATNYPAIVTDVSVKGLNILLDGDLTDAIYVGGIVGQLQAIGTTPNKIEKAQARGKITFSSSRNYTTGSKDRTYAFGGIVGYTKQNSTTFSEVNQCISEVDFDLSKLTPSTTNNFYSGFVVGGVIGRLEAPSRLPEQLFYGGKIYAPSAAVGPIVGVFCTNLAANTYIYDDYSGENASNVTNEWAKADTWFYNGYKIGLPSDVTGQTLNTTESSTSGTDGISYLTIGENTLTAFNSISGATKSSKTILAYTAISPNWTTNNSTYPACYMYYMQGVNRGAYTSTPVETKAAILAGTLTIMTLVDDKGDLTIEDNRGFVSHTLTATTSASVSIDSYNWYVNGTLQTGTSNIFAYTPDISVNTVAVEAIKGGKVVKRLECRIVPVFRVSDATAAMGTKDNPYLLGSADELKLLSYLSTLPGGVTWEKGYDSNNHYNKAYYELDDDIDLSGVADFTPISFLAPTNSYTQNYIFDGVFDGKGHTIRGLKETWRGGVFNNNDYNNGWGLFAFVGNPNATVKVGDSSASNAVIKNLVIDDATLTHDTNNTTFFYNNGTSNANNCHVGILAGVVTSNTTIQNIEIRNSKITDEGSSDYNLATRGLFVGGAIGSLQNAFNATANSVTNTKIDHIAAQVDITMNHPTFTSGTTRSDYLGVFNIGGIIGRYWATGATWAQVQNTMPAYTFYSGSITAPKAWISPVLAAVRYVDQQTYGSNGNSMASFSKQWEGNNNSAATQLTITNAQYYNFRINGTLMTELRPATACARGARPIMEHTDATETADTYNARKYQGVNYDARHIDSEGTSLEYLNDNVADGIYWEWYNGFVHMTATQPMNVSVTAGYRTYSANIENGSDPESYRWQESTDLENWTDISGATSSTWSVPLTFDEEKYVVLHVIKDGKVYRSFPFLFIPSTDIKSPTIVEDIAGDQHNFSIDWHDLNLTGMNVSYQWYQSDQTTEIGGATVRDLSLSSSQLENYGESVWCKVTVTYDASGETFAEYFLSSGMVVVYVNGKNGIDNEPGSRVRGWTDTTPVKTIDHANSLLGGGPWEKNIIVVMGRLSSGTAEENCFKSRGTNPATLTGWWDGIDYEGEINLVKGAESNANPGDGPSKNGFHNYVSADTKFENLILRAAHDVDNMFLELHGHDVWLGKGLRMQGFRDLSAGHGNLDEDKQTTPEFSIILTSTNPAHPDEAYWTHTKPQVLTIESGHYGRILGGRYVSGFFTNAGNTSHSILATAKHPAWAVINIDIDPDNDMKSADGKKTYTCDVNCIVAGLTDGSIYGDYQINIHGGNVRYAVGANQGNSVVSGDKTYTPIGGTSGKWGQWPNASFFGRTIINVDQKNGLKPITLNNLYAGGLGRNADAASTANTVVDMYVYGHTEINMKSGFVSKNVYGGGAGGVIGLNPWDAHIPYATNDADNASSAIFNGVQYGDNRVTGAWSTKTVSDPLVNVTLHKIDDDGNFTSETEVLNLANSSTTLNITGGNIGGNVFGGGNGYVSNMPIQGTMQGVGSVFGTSNVNISGGTISGSVYGGSEGNSGYYGKVNKHGQKITHIAEMVGTVNLNITGTKTIYPTIGGDIYGAGKGIESTASEEYLCIATAGNYDLAGPGATDEEKEKYKTDINILIDLPESHPFTGNIYGGGEMGAVDGKTHVTIKGGVFEKDIFGAGKGEDGHINKAKVTGTSGVTIDGGSIQSTVYGGGALAIVDGDTEVNLNDGTLYQDVFGGGMGELNADHTTKTSADVTGTAAVTANGSTFDFPENGIDLSVNHNIYGGGNFASVVGATNVTINQGLLKAGFLDGDGSSSWGKWIDAVNAQTDNVAQGSVFGGGYGVNTSVTNTAAVHVKITDNDATNKAMIDVIGGGYNGYVLSKTDVTVAGAAEIYKVYGGGLGSYDGYENAPAEYRSHANLASFTKQETIGSVGEGKENDGTSVTVHGGKIYNNIFGGGAGLRYDAHGVGYLRVAEVFGKSNVTVDAIDSWDETHAFSNKVYGGGALGLVDNEILVDIKSGTFQGAELFAGSLGEKGHLDKAQVTASATIRTSSNDSETAGALQGYFNIYGGCDMAQLVGDTHVELQHGTFSGSIFGAGKGLASEETSPGVWDEHLDYGKVTGNTLIVIDEPSLVLGLADGLNTDGSIKDIKKAIKIYGGGALGLVDGTINPVTLRSGTIYGEVFGGSLGELEHPDKAKVTMPDGKYLGVITEASKTNIVEGKPAALNGKITIYGGCDMALVDGNTNVEIGHGAFIGNVFGGGKGISGSEVYGKVDGDASVLIKGGDTRSDVYGGGALGNVTGKTTVDLAGGAVNDVYGGGLGDANTAAIVFGDALVTLNGSTADGVTNDCKVYGSIFGCNNVNGTPKGHAKVHVLKTITRAGQSTPRNQKEEKTNSYDVFAVYGGGNHAAYQPENKDEYAEVLIENCDNSIDYVYGGGNAAPVPATSVTIYGANAINNAFAGGNGAGADNPGADVGYKGHYSKGSREEYGSGEAHINIYGGTINNVYGGSNTLGYIRTHAYVEVLNVPDGDTEHNCDLRLGEVHAGGNEAEMYCGGSVTLACSEGAEVVYAGSSDADIHGDIDLVITSGTYGKVFGGNNHSGNVYGGIKINIDETGCWPVMIGELYACGNEAPYSVYGYDDEGNAITEGEPQYTDPTINLISFTRIGKVFGGGYAAAVYGSPTINVEPIPGIYATVESKPNYMLNGSDERTENTGNLSVADALGADKISSIGTIYGGGNKGAVYGNTNVLIGTKTTNKHVSGTDKTTEHDVAVTITGNIFGGGNEAIVSGNTNVTIGKE